MIYPVTSRGEVVIKGPISKPSSRTVTSWICPVEISDSSQLRNHNQKVASIKEYSSSRYIQIYPALSAIWVPQFTQPTHLPLHVRMISQLPAQGVHGKLFEVGLETAENPWF